MKINCHTGVTTASHTSYFENSNKKPIEFNTLVYFRTTRNPSEITNLNVVRTESQKTETYKYVRISLTRPSLLALHETQMRRDRLVVIAHELSRFPPDKNQTFGRVRTMTITRVGVRTLLDAVCINPPPSLTIENRSRFLSWASRQLPSYRCFPKASIIETQL